MASANQHSDPALSPHITTPDSHASRSATSSPCARSTPIRQVTLPPPTYTRACSSSCARTPAVDRPMIARIWRGAPAADRAQEYLDYLRRTGLADYKGTPGNHGVQV